jgi:hypothetical protein
MKKWLKGEKPKSLKTKGTDFRFSEFQTVSPFRGFLYLLSFLYNKNNTKTREYKKGLKGGIVKKSENGKWESFENNNLTF